MLWLFFCFWISLSLSVCNHRHQMTLARCQSDNHCVLSLMTDPYFLRIVTLAVASYMTQACILVPVYLVIVCLHVAPFDWSLFISAQPCWLCIVNHIFIKQRFILVPIGFCLLARTFCWQIYTFSASLHQQDKRHSIVDYLFVLCLFVCQLFATGPCVMYPSHVQLLKAAG